MTLSARFAVLLILYACALGGCEQAGTPVSTNGSPPTSDQLTPAAVAETKKSPAASQTPRECTFDDIKFDMVIGDPFKREMLTPKIEDLVGERIRIRGYILPSFQQRGLTEFVLVRDNLECCFGPGAALYDCILVSMQPGKSTDFSIRPVAVEGVFSVNEIIGPDGTHLAIYHLQADAVTN